MGISLKGFGKSSASGSGASISGLSALPPQVAANRLASPELPAETGGSVALGTIGTSLGAFAEDAIGFSHNINGDFTWRSRAESAEMNYTIPDGYTAWGGAWLPLSPPNPGLTYTNGNRDVQDTLSSGWGPILANSYSTGKYYFEIEFTAIGADTTVHILGNTFAGYDTTNGRFAGNAYHHNWGGGTFTSGDILSVAVDLDTDALYCWINGVAV